MRAVRPYTWSEVQRLLPRAGEVTVLVGQRVEPSDVVGVATLAGELRLLPVARALSVPEDGLDPYWVAHVSEEVHAEAAIARRQLWGPLRREVRAPAPGRIGAASHGRALLELRPSRYELRALVKGMVAQVILNRGVFIQVPGALVEATWGVGQEAYGPLKFYEEDEGPLDAKQVDLRYHHTILVARGWADEAALRQSAEVEVRGMLLGSLPPGLRSRALGLPYPILLSEGFGQLRMVEPIFSLLSTHEGREAFLEPQARRPRLIVPLARTLGTPEEPPAPRLLREGDVVRVLAGPRLGQVGQVSDAQLRNREVGSQIALWGVEVSFEAGGSSFVPLANLELLI